MKYDAEATAKRAYRQGARAEAAAATHRRIADVFQAHMRDRWLDEITLDQIAADAGVTVQTVIRRFGGKDGLIEAVAERFDREIPARRGTPSGDIPTAIGALVADYELTGDVAIRMLAQEPRHPVLRPLLNRGRASHRAWNAAVFEPWLARLPAGERERRLAALVANTDVYVWKLLRRDMAFDADATAAVMQDAVTRLLADTIP